MGLVQRTAPLGLSPAQSWDYKGPFVPPAASLDREWLQESSQLNSWLEFYGKLQGCLVKGAGVASFHFTFVNLLVNYDYFLLLLFFPSFFGVFGIKKSSLQFPVGSFCPEPFFIAENQDLESKIPNFGGGTLAILWLPPSQKLPRSLFLLCWELLVW